TDPASGRPLGSPARLTEGGNTADFLRASADGKRLIYPYLRSSDAIYLGNLELGAEKFNPRRLTLEEWNNWPTGWTRDSEAVLFHSIRSGRYAILQQRIDQQTPEILLSGAENYRRPVFSPARDRLLYTASPTAERLDPSQRLMSKPLEGGDPIVLLPGSYSYRWGSVPSAGCVMAEVQGHQLVFFNLDSVKGKGTEIQRLDILNSNTERNWSLSPDGNKIAVADEGTHRGEIRILTLGNHTVVTLPLQGWKWDTIQSTAWSADGEHLFATALSKSSVVILVDLRGNLQELAEVAGGGGVAIFSGAFTRRSLPRLHEENRREQRSDARKLLSRWTVPKGTLSRDESA